MSSTIHFRQGIKNLPEICVQHGIRKVVIAPGSRNVPLVLAFTSHPELDCLPITDERSAGYFALGIAQQSSEAVALICTSGTAVLNFAPAIAEAYYQNIPLVVFTADRPAELIDQADGQTIRQTNIYQNYCKASFELPVETVHIEDLSYSDRVTSQAIDIALNFPCGPVHINVPMREPVYVTLPKTHTNPKIIHTAKTEVTLSEDSLKEFQTAWKKYTKKLVVIGILPKNKKTQKLAQLLSKEPDTVVIAENLSNISGEKIISTPEALFASLKEEDKMNFTPDLLITIGHSVICKQLKLFLRAHKPQAHWQLDSSLPYIDTYQSLQTIIPSTAIAFIEKMPLGVKSGNYASIFQKQQEIITSLSSNFMENVPYSDWMVVRKLLKTLPADVDIQLANSTAVRITQLFPSKECISYFCNRGTSGIDGSLSTAVGAAYASKKPTYFLTGDLSFIYDSNGLWNKQLPNNLKIIILNNNGGNIFRIIGNSELTEDCEEFLTTPHQIDIRALAKAYGVHYIQCVNEEKLNLGLRELYESKVCTIMEVMTKPEVNTKLYKHYFERIKNHKPQ